MVVHTSDRYSFLLIEIQFERSKLGNSKKIELSSELSGVHDIRASVCMCVGVCTHKRMRNLEPEHVLRVKHST